MASLPPSSLEYRGTEEGAKTVRAIAVAGVIFGTLGLSCLPFNLGAFITYGWPIESSQTTISDLWCLASTFIGLGLSTILLFGSLGSYHFKWWGRYALLFWAVCSVGYGLVGIYFWGRFLLPWLRTEYAAMRGPDELSGIIAWIIGTGLSIFVLIYYTRPSLAAVFRPSEMHHPHPEANH